MKDLIERYVYDVTRRLPEKNREEVEKELIANISDMLGDNPTDEEVKNVLLSLGHPRKLANSYRDRQRYLISPEWMDDYLLVLRIVLTVLGIVALITGVVENLLNPSSNHLMGIILDMIANTISGVVSALFSGFAIVTLIFIAIEHYNYNRKDVFKIKNLPELPLKDKKEIPRVGAITSLVFTVIFGGLFIYLLIADKFAIFWFDNQMQINVLVYIFNSDVVSVLLPLIIISFGFTVFVEIYKLTKNRWNLTTFLLYTAARVLATVVTIIFITSKNLFTTEFITEVANFFNTSFRNIEDGAEVVFIILSILISVGAFAEILLVFFKKKIYKAN